MNFVALLKQRASVGLNKITLTIEETTQQFFLASEEKRVCRVILEREPLPRMVWPLGIASTMKNNIVVVCWQSAGFTKAGSKAGYRHLQLERVIEIEVLDTHFQIPADFNPTDGQYKDWVYHV